MSAMIRSVEMKAFTITIAMAWGRGDWVPIIEEGRRANVAEQ